MANKNTKSRVKSVNFGERGNKARSIMEAMEKKLGNAGFSKFMRKALIASASDSKEFNQIKISGILEERKEVKRQMKRLNNTLKETEDELNELGYNLDIGE